MAVYAYECARDECDFEETRYNQNPNKPLKFCPTCKKKSIFIVINSVPAMRMGKDHFTKGGKDALIYQDFNKKHKKNADVYNRHQ